MTENKYDLNLIREGAQKYYEQMKAAAAAGTRLEDVLDPEAANALRKITAQAKQQFGDVQEAPSAIRTIPSIIEHDNNGNRVAAYDIYSYLIKNRVILLEGPVDDTMKMLACATLLFLDSPMSGGAGKDIHVYVDSPGGSVIAGLAIYDTMRFMSSKVNMVGFGMQASMGSILLASGDTRAMTEHSKLMIHQLSGGSRGQATDMALSLAFSEQLHEDLKSIYVRHIGFTHEFWDIVMERDTWLTAQQALEIGFIDQIVPSHASKKTAYEDETVRHEFKAAAKNKVPKTAEGIIKMLNNVSARQGESASVRAELVVALSKFPQFWTEAKKREMAQKAAANQNTKPGADAPKLSA